MNLIKCGCFKEWEDICHRMTRGIAVARFPLAELFSLTINIVRIKHLPIACLLLVAPMTAPAEPSVARPAPAAASAVPAAPAAPIHAASATPVAPVVPATPAPHATPVAPDTIASTSILRVVCEKDGAGAEVMINGVARGKCPVIIKVPPGQLNLQVKKASAPEQIFEKQITIGGNESKKVTAIFSASRPNAAENQNVAKKKHIAKKKNFFKKKQVCICKPVATKRPKAVKHKPRKQVKVEKHKPAQKAMDAKHKIAEARRRAKLSRGMASGMAVGAAGMAIGAVPTVATIRDCSDCPEMVVIPQGEFTMGSPSTEARRQNVEGPEHLVTIKNAFAMGKTEVTRAQFAAFVSKSKFEAGDKCWTFEDSKYEERSTRNWLNPGYQQTDSHPVTCVSWMDAKAYAEWLSRETGKQYRLPSEAEWEYAARGSTKRGAYQKINSEKTCGSGNVMDVTAKKEIRGVTWEAHKCDDGYAYTSPVGSFSKNAFGLYDMIGNLWEWVEDSNHNNYIGAPVDGSAWQGDGVVRLLRGGSWSDDAQGSRVAARGKARPDLRNSTIGFRVVRNMP